MKTRKSSGFSLFRRIWSPIGHMLQAGEESSQRIGVSAGKMAKEGIGAVRNIGTRIARHTNEAIHGLTRRKKKQSGGRRRKTYRARRCASC
jgi:hypothetical protein